MKTNLIIAGFSGIVKTYLGNKYQNVIDLDAATYAYTDIGLENLNIEERKILIKISQITIKSYWKSKKTIWHNTSMG